ncbi:MAG: PIN domain-containing protein, partial [Acidobacteriaceae bacterium]
MSLYLLDTNMVSFTLWGVSPAARARLAKLSPYDVVSISAVTEGELLFGLAKSPNERRQRALQQYLSPFVIYPWGREAAAAYGDLRARQERLGKKLGPYDMQIAAHALALKATLVSHDK